MKNCLKCNIELIPGENCSPSRFNNATYWCSKCFYKHKGKKNNIKTYNRKTRRKYYDDVYETQHKPGIYGIYHKDELIYIGESVRPKRRVMRHFSKTKKTDSATSPIAHNVYTGKFKREDLSYKIFLEVEDTKERKCQEKLLIQQYQPVFNDKFL